MEGKLGGQAQSTEVAGVWKDLTDNVNQLAANLTNQVRAIAEVATAVTEGDLTRQVGVEASGEVAVLKDKLNEMIRNLRETTRQNIEQDWLKTNLERFTRMLQGQRDLRDGVEHDPLRTGAAWCRPSTASSTRSRASDGGEPVLELQAGYGYEERKHLANHVPARRRAGRPVREGEEADPAHRRPGRLRPDQLRARRVDAAQHHRAADPLRRVGARGRRAGVVLPVQPDPSGIPRPAHREHRPRAQHDRGQHADREPAQAVAVAGGGAAARQEELRSSNDDLERQAQNAWPSRTSRSSARTRRSSSPSGSWRRRPSSWRSRRSTSRSSSPTCRTSCARR